MSDNQEFSTLHSEMDDLDKYFECIAACSLGDEGVECVTKCVQVHLKVEDE